MWFIFFLPPTDFNKDLDFINRPNEISLLLLWLWKAERLRLEMCLVHVIDGARIPGFESIKLTVVFLVFASVFVFSS